MLTIHLLAILLWQQFLPVHNLSQYQKRRVASRKSDIMRQNAAPQNVDPSHGQPDDPDALDLELARWFALHGGAWSGTLSELLRTLKTETSLSDDILPTSAEVLYAHIAAHRQLLRSSGIEVTLGQGYPRIVSLRSSPKQESEQVSPSLAREGKSAQASAAEHHFASKVSDSPSP